MPGTHYFLLLSDSGRMFWAAFISISVNLVVHLRFWPESELGKSANEDGTTELSSSVAVIFHFVAINLLTDVCIEDGWETTLLILASRSLRETFIRLPGCSCGDGVRGGDWEDIPLFEIAGNEDLTFFFRRPLMQIRWVSEWWVDCETKEATLRALNTNQTPEPNRNDKDEMFAIWNVRRLLECLRVSGMLDVGVPLWHPLMLLG